MPKIARLRLAYVGSYHIDRYLGSDQGRDVVGMHRLALQDFTFKDGTVIPKGTMICAAQRATHTDSSYYDDPLTFDPWRFSRIREEEGDTMKLEQLATTASVGYIPFGLGRYAW